MSVYLRFLLLLLSLFFRGDIFAQVSFVDTVNLTNKTSGLKLWYLSENKYLLTETQESNDTLVLDSNQMGISLDSVLVKIQEFREKCSIKMTSQNQFSIVLCLANTQFEMMEMRNLFERLSDMEIRVKVELPIKY
jgi:glutaminase